MRSTSPSCFIITNKNPSCKFTVSVDYSVWMCCVKAVLRYVMSSGRIFRAAGAGGLQRAREELGPGLWSLSASSPRWPGALLHPVPPRLPECTGLRVGLYFVVSRPVSSKKYQFSLFCAKKNKPREHRVAELLWEDVLLRVEGSDRLKQRSQHPFNLNFDIDPIPCINSIMLVSIPALVSILLIFGSIPPPLKMNPNDLDNSI